MPTAAVLVAEGSEEIETYAPADVLVRAGVRVTMVGVGGLRPVGSRGLPMHAERLVGAVRGSLFDAVLIPGGGPGALVVAESEAAGKMVMRHTEVDRLVCAICAAPAMVLGPLGLLCGVRATGHPSTRDLFPSSTEYVDDEPVVECGNLITSRGPATAIAFGLAIAARLTSRTKAAEVAEAMLV